MWVLDPEWASVPQRERFQTPRAVKAKTLSQKSKLRTREKRHQAEEDPEELGDAQATAGVQGEFSSTSSPCSKAIPQSSTSGAISNPQVPGRAPSTATTDVTLSYIRANERTNNEVEERPRSSPAQHSTEHLPKDPVAEKVLLLIWYLLCKYQMKELISKANMLTNVIQMHKRHYLEILSRASEHLGLIFHLDMRKVEPHRHIYVLVKKLEPSCYTRLRDDRGVPKTGLLMIILCVIFKKRKHSRKAFTTEEQIWQILNVMGLYERRYHFIWGEPSKLITRDLVQENNLEYWHVPDSGPPRYVFLWGPRDQAETNKMKVLEFLAEVHNTITSAFPLWYAEALKDEEERAQARVAARARISAMASARLGPCPAAPHTPS
ncbi:melanoma-associated antigen B10-like [Cynocephalus volans]|uniref:melanoma-associated antigen B10-like n=1 Tax=Cynocephalus volans TaxID=110931 RepID=UPI002FCA302E